MSYHQPPYQDYHSTPLFDGIAPQRAACDLPTEHDASTTRALLARLLPVSNGVVGDSPTMLVNGRQLHAVLGSKQQCVDWLKARISQNHFIENLNFVRTTEDAGVFHNSMKNLGGRPRVEIYFTLDAAKRIAMAEHTAVGDEVRTYFLECEERALEAMRPKPGSIVLDFNSLRSVRQSFAALLDHTIALEGERDAYKHEAETARPAVEFCKTALRNNAEMLISDFGRILKARYPELGPNLIFKRLWKEGYLFQGRHKKWRPVADYITSGLFRPVYGAEFVNPKTGRTERDIQTYITEKGRQHFVRRWGITDYDELVAIDDGTAFIERQVGA